ncbi:ribosome biogenesis protein TSR3 isoform X1, partial [Aphis craccivora]
CCPNLYPNINKLLKILSTLPVSTSTPERSFSTLKRVKTYLRNSMAEDRLNGLSMLAIHKDVIVTPDEVLDEMAKKPRKLEILFLALGKWRPHRPVPLIGCCNSPTLVLGDRSGLALQESNILPRDRVTESRLENCKSALRFGTWNIRTLYQPGAALTLVKEFNKYRLEILAIQEIRWSGQGSTEIDNSIIFFGQCDNCRQGGTGFIVKKNIAPAIKDFKVVNSRLTILIVEGKFFNVVFVNAHAPSEDKSDEEKEEFYSLLESKLEGIPRHCIIILLGDFSAKIGKEECFKTTTVSNSLHQLSNNNGFRLIELATGMGLKIKSTSFPHNKIHKGTWRSPGGRYINQIDHVLVSARFSNSILDVRTFRGAECGSDHFLVFGKLKVKLKKIKKRKEEQAELFDIQKLCDLKTCEDFFGKRRFMRNPWFNQICENALQRRKQAREVWLKDIQNEEKFSRYKSRLKEATKIIRCEKRKFIKDIVRKIFLRNENDNLLTDRDDIVEEWAQYFDPLLNCREPSNPFLFKDKEPNREDYPEPTIEEVAKQIKTLKNHKAHGEDGITGEILKTGAENLVKYIHRLINLIWQKEEIPKEWKTALVYPIHKKGDKQTCNNYRGIALLNVTYKILSYCILDRIKPWAEEIIGGYQAGFRQNRSTIDQIFILRQHMIQYIDYRASLIKILEDFGMPSKLISLVECSISHTDIKVKVGQTLSKTVQVTTGLRQGDAISPVLFNIVLEKVVREADLDKEGVKLGENNIGILAYADDIVLMAESKDKLKEQSKKLINAAKRVGLEINAEKTEYMAVQRHEQIGCRNEVLEVENYKFKRVQQFKYL